MTASWRSTTTKLTGVGGRPPPSPSAWPSGPSPQAASSARETKAVAHQRAARAAPDAWRSVPVLGAPLAGITALDGPAIEPSLDRAMPLHRVRRLEDPVILIRKV